MSCKMLLTADMPRRINEVLSLQRVRQAALQVSPYTQITHVAVRYYCFEQLVGVPALRQTSSQPVGGPSTIVSNQ